MDFFHSAKFSRFINMHALDRLLPCLFFWGKKLQKFSWSALQKYILKIIFVCMCFVMNHKNGFQYYFKVIQQA